MTAERTPTNIDVINTRLSNITLGRLYTYTGGVVAVMMLIYIAWSDLNTTTNKMREDLKDAVREFKQDVQLMQRDMDYLKDKQTRYYNDLERRVEKLEKLHEK
ncbi:MAG: hypothetical protein H6550_16340 [Chitinophagales bacterium]|nr:hypothetical protein [Chitinophagales bacterium]